MPPDGQGRYSLSELEDRVYRVLKQTQAVVNSTTRAESSLSYPSQAFSNVDVDQQLNASLVGLYSEIIIGREDQFSTTSYQSVQANNPGPYGFPPNMLQLRYMEWIDPGIGQANAQPQQWVPMLEYTDPIDRQMTQNYRGPTWKFASSGTAFMLNQNPSMNNPSGIRIEAVVLPPELVNSTDYINAKFVRILQQACIYDAALVLAKSRHFSVAADIASDREEWHQRLISTADNAYHPPSTIVTNNRLPSLSYSGRRGRRSWR